MKTKMKKIISLLLAAIMLTCALSACDWGVHPVPEDGKPSSDASYTPHKFGVEDAAFNDVKIGMTPEHVKKILGAPRSEELNTTDEFIYGAYIDMEYDAISLMFYDVNEGEDYTLGSICAKTPDAKFTGGLHIGSSKEDVLAVFTQTDNPEPLYFAGTEESCGDYIYGDTNSTYFYEDKPTDVIQYAYINRYGEDIDNSYMMEYYYYNPLDWNADKSEYTGDCYSMVFYLDSETDTVRDIRISYDLAL